MIHAIYLSTLAAVALAAVGVVVFEQGNESNRRTLQRTTVDDLEARRVSLGEVLDGRLLSTKPGRRLADRLTRSGVDRSVGGFLATVAAMSAAVWFVAGRVLPGTLALVAAAAVGVGAHFWLDRQAGIRREQIVAELPDLARLLSNAASAGLALRAAMELAVRQLEGPIRDELQRVIDALQVGVPVDEALRRLSERVPSRELSVLVTTLIVQHRAGGELISALQNVAGTLEDRQELRREVRTMVSGAVSSSWTVAGLGLGSLVLTNLINPGSLDRMLASSAGKLVFLVSGTLYAAAFVVIRRAVAVEV